MNYDKESKLYELLLKKSNEFRGNHADPPGAAYTFFEINLQKWHEYLKSIGIGYLEIDFPPLSDRRAYAKSKSPEGTICVENPVVFPDLDRQNRRLFVLIPDDLALKALALGGFP